MNGHITISEIDVRTHIGVPPAERAVAQRLLITVSFALPTLEMAAQSDDLRHTIDYAEVRESILEVCATGERQLIETLAADIIHQLKKRHGLKQLSLRIEKFPLPDTRAVILTVQA